MTDMIPNSDAPIATNNNTPETTSTFGFNDFINQFQPEQRQVFEKQGVKDFETLHKSYHGLLSKIGEKGLIPPKDTATDIEKSDFQKQLYKHIGVPSDGKYEYSIADDINADLVSDDFVNNLADIALKQGISKTAFETIVNQIYREFTPEYQNLVNEIEQLKSRLGQEGKMDIASQSISTQDLTLDIDAKRRDFFKAQNEGRTQDAIILKNEYNALINKQMSLQK